MAQKQYNIIASEDGMRIDYYVAIRCQSLSRNHVKRLLSQGLITVNTGPVKASYKVKNGDNINIVIPQEKNPNLLKAWNISLSIVYEDKDIIVVDKPAGIPTHPSPGHPDSTLVNAILGHTIDLAEATAGRPGIVHRLDKDTSGLLVIAKNRRALTNIAEQFKHQTIHKVYTVLVKGYLRPDKGTIDAPIGRNPFNRKRMAVLSSGRQAVTHYCVLKHINDFTLLEATIKTGRTHQIRVHFSAIGFPVVGDSTYGYKVDFLKRQFVHAQKLGFDLPSNGKYVEFSSSLPPDLQLTLKHLSK
jgi:23S rRNA pseudouridine1911/1915/1917 synthase